MEFWDPSKSSMYDVTSPLKLFPFGAPGIRYAISPRTERLDGTSVWIFGSLLTNLVNKGISFEKSIMNADIGLNPTNDGEVIRIPIPPLS